MIEYCSKILSNEPNYFKSKCWITVKGWKKIDWIQYQIQLPKDIAKLILNKYKIENGFRLQCNYLAIGNGDRNDQHICYKYGNDVILLVLILHKLDKYSFNGNIC